MNYHMNVKTISRGNNASVTRSVSYICGRNLFDSYNALPCYKNRDDVIYQEISLPNDAPQEFYDLQKLCDEINKAEKRYDARTARLFVGSLPNELPNEELIKIVKEFIEWNFVNEGLGVVFAIHEGRNKYDPSKNNPHVHIIVTTRTIDSRGFSKKKARQFDSRMCIYVWRERWAELQNRYYERNGLEMRVSHESLEVQGKDREPTIHLSFIDYQKEKRGERTYAGDKKRAIKKRNEDKLRTKRELERKREHEHTIDRIR